MTIQDATERALEQPTKDLLVPALNADPELAFRLKRLGYLIMGYALSNLTPEFIAHWYFGQSQLHIGPADLAILADKAVQLGYLVQTHPEIADAVLDSLTPTLKEHMPFINLDSHPWENYGGNDA